LARKSRADDVRIGKLRSSNIAQVRNVRPTPSQNLAGVWLDLAERHRAETARALQAKIEAANAGEE
jgi:hypothetical protein